MSVEKELGALQEGLKHISTQLEKAEAGRKQTYERLETVDRRLDHFEWDLNAIKEKLDNITPTVTKVERLHLQAEGASKLGILATRAGSIIFTMAASAVSAWATIQAWINWK